MQKIIALKITDESKVGIFAVFTMIILLFGLNMLKGKNIFVKNATYYAVYDHIAGLSESNPILINGHQVGKVYSIHLNMDERKVLVVLSVKREIDLPVGTIAKIIDMDILGAKAVELILTENPEMHKRNDTLIGLTAISIGSTVENMISPVIHKIDSTLAGILASVLDDNGQNNLKASIDNLRCTTDNIKKMTDQINQGNVIGRFSRIVANVESISNTLKENQDEIDLFMNNLSTLSDSIDAAQLAATIRKANDMVTEVNFLMQKINNGEGSLGQLVNDKKLYENLELTSQNLNTLIVDLKNKPKRYVHFSIFGRSGKDDATSKNKEK